jgi:hypothetical protein
VYAKDVAAEGQQNGRLQNEHLLAVQFKKRCLRSSLINHVFVILANLFAVPGNKMLDFLPL